MVNLLFYIFLVFWHFLFSFTYIFVKKIWKTHFVVQFLSFPVSMVEKCFGQVLTTFRAWALLKEEKLKTGPRWLSLVPETYPHFLRWNSYRFPSIRLKNVSVEFWPPKLKIGPEWLGFAPKTYPHYLRCNFYRSLSVRTKNVLVECWQLFGAWAPSKQEKLKTGPRWLGLAPRTYPHFFECTSYCFTSAWLKNILLEFWRLFWTRIPREEAKLKIKPGWLDFAPET